MQVVIFIVFVVLVGYLLLMIRRKSAEGGAVVQGDNSEAGSEHLKPYYISHGKLFFKDESGSIQQHHSQHIQTIAERLERKKEQHGWKENTSFATSYANMQGMAGQGADSGVDNIMFTSIIRAGDNELLYFLKDTSFGGLFRYDQATGKELRLLHRQNLSLIDLSQPDEQGRVLCASEYSSGASNIVMMDKEADRLNELTGGDSIDSAPSWVAGEKEQLVYQTQGLARSPEGFVIGVGPVSINILNMANNELSTVFSDAAYDYLCPKVSSDGCLYFIRRPYETPIYKGGSMLMDAIFFPFRLIRAVFHYLNFFSMTYSRKPLTSASGPQIQEDAGQLLLKGRRIDAEKALKQAKGLNGVPSLVPATWQLICCDPQGKQTCIGKSVLAYSLAADGEVFYTNGCGVFKRDKHGSLSLLLRDKLIEDFSV